MIRATGNHEINEQGALGSGEIGGRLEACRCTGREFRMGGAAAGPVGLPAEFRNLILNQYDYRDGCKSVPRGGTRFREEFSRILFAGSVAHTLGCSKNRIPPESFRVPTVLHLLFAGFTGLAGASIPPKKSFDRKRPHHGPSLSLAFRGSQPIDLIGQSRSWPRHLTHGYRCTISSSALPQSINCRLYRPSKIFSVWLLGSFRWVVRYLC